MTKRKRKNPTAETSIQARNGTVPDRKAPAKRPRSSHAQAGPGSTSATATSVATAPTTPAEAWMAKKKAKSGKLSARDAAAQVLVEAGQPMTCQAMIDAMAQKGYWTSPGGRTPAATLYAAILRELKTKAEQARFAKTERGKFVRK